MAREFVRSVKNVKDINTINDNITEENDLISDVNGNVYIRKKTGYQLLNVANDKHINDLQNLIKKIDNVEYDFNGLKIDLNNYAKKSDIPEQLDLSPYAKKSDLTKYVKLIDLNNFITDTGWIDIELINNVLPYKSSSKPQYKIINYNGTLEVSIRGEVKGIKKENTVIGVIPNIEIPYTHPVLQPTSKKTVNDVKTSTYGRWVIKSVNNVTQIIMEGVSYDTNLMLETDWYPINTSIKI